MPRVAILLPCRDAAAHLPDAITSLTSQTLRDYEVIAVDDHSTDNTAELLHAWAARDARVRVLANNGTGLVAALVHALAEATAPMIARMDADDIAEPRRLELQHAFLTEHADI